VLSSTFLNLNVYTPIAVNLTTVTTELSE